MSAAGTATLAADEGQVVARVNTDSDFARDEHRSEDLLWRTESDEGLGLLISTASIAVPHGRSRRSHAPSGAR